MNKTPIPASAAKTQHRRSPLSAPMAQQSRESFAGSTPQSLVQLIGCHDPGQRRLHGKTDSRSAIGALPIE
ncbi:hypothetical protein [Bradyrhizobium sp. ORS 285]|uniref:hypothetical protein n=1 Tax=Bradyrhizobium sp. ORS 285 TaxID=115808 RepID=UPI0002409541|nr:hypothetical protein [Bradyrhizobium sp. ORS 285]CCD88136.1 conserved hypothetical protein [Bradyrhizobium sp. ORS 285]